jgi:hypothetical protein
MNLMELQELMQFELGAPVCAWISFQLMKGIWKFEFMSFLDLLQEFDSKSFDFFYSSLLRVGLPMNFIA